MMCFPWRINSTDYDRLRRLWSTSPHHHSLSVSFSKCNLTIPANSWADNQWQREKKWRKLWQMNWWLEVGGGVCVVMVAVLVRWLTMSRQLTHTIGSNKKKTDSVRNETSPRDVLSTYLPGNFNYLPLVSQAKLWFQFLFSGVSFFFASTTFATKDSPRLVVLCVQFVCLHHLDFFFRVILSMKSLLDVRMDTFIINQLACSFSLLICLDVCSFKKSVCVVYWIFQFNQFVFITVVVVLVLLLVDFRLFKSNLQAKCTPIVFNSSERCVSMCSDSLGHRFVSESFSSSSFFCSNYSLYSLLLFCW